MCGRGERIDQRHHVLHSAVLHKLRFFADLRCDAQLLQLGGHALQAVALAAEHHDLACQQWLALSAAGRLVACCICIACDLLTACDLLIACTALIASILLITASQVLRHPAGGLRAFPGAYVFLGLVTRCGQRVAPHGGVSVVIARFGLRQRQAQHLACGGRFCSVHSVAFVARVGCSLHDTVDSGQHAACVAARVVAAQHHAAQGAAYKFCRGHKHLRLSAAKAVNALLGVAYDKHAGCAARTTCTRATPCSCIASKPGLQCLPLQRVGVLKLVYQQVPGLRV